MENPVTIAGRPHLFPSRTQKLSSLAPMILGGKLPGKVGRCRFFISIKTYDGIKNCAECEALAPFFIAHSVAVCFLFGKFYRLYCAL